MKRKVLAGLVGGLTVIALIAGCDWQGGSSADTISDRYNWANFSGVYRGYNGGLLVTDYSVTPGVANMTNLVTGASGGTTDGVRLQYSGRASPAPIIAGSMTITAGNYAWQDNNTGVMSYVGPAAGGAAGTIDYATGAWTIQATPAMPAGQRITVRYAYSRDSNNTGPTSAGSGASGIRILSFSVDQDGNMLIITDNNGSVYNGQIASIRGTGGQSQDTPVELNTSPAVNDTVIASYNASGTSAAGKEVNLTGTFTGTANYDTSNRVSFTNRRMTGTWIEKNGRTGDINGQASPLTITVPAP